MCVERAIDNGGDGECNDIPARLPMRRGMGTASMRYLRGRFVNAFL